VYQSQLNDNSFEELLTTNRQRDRFLQYTTAGIHRDELDMLLSGYPLKKHGSQGQQKTYQVALKLGKFEFIRKVTGITPILLMDDIFDKFDLQRVEKIIRLVSENNFGQIFITDTDKKRMKVILNRIGIDYKIFEIDEEQQINLIS
jgi:DNA replication and repair protein RecF